MKVEVIDPRGVHGRRDRRYLQPPRPHRRHGSPRAARRRCMPFVPLSEMFGYATDLRSRTQGRGLFTMQFDHYEEVPKSIAEKVIGKK